MDDARAPETVGTTGHVESLRREVERLRLLAQNERGLLDAVLNHSPHGVIVCDAAGQLVLHNKAAERIWGGSATAENVDGWGKYRAFHADGRPYEAGDWAMARCLSRGETTLEEETRFQRFDDTYGVLLGSSAPFFDATGALAGAVSVFSDITEVVRARERVRVLLGSAPAAIATWRGPKHVFELANARYLEIVRRSSVAETTVDQMLPEVGGQRMVDVFDEVYATGEPFVANEYRVPLRGEDAGAVVERFFAFHLEATRDAGGAIDGVMAVATDVTEQVGSRKRAEQLTEQLEHALARSQLAVDVSRSLTGDAALATQLRMCTEAMVHHLDAAFARIWTLNPTGSVLELQASAGLYTHVDGAHARVPVGSFKIGRIAKERQPHRTNDVQNDPQVSDQAWAAREGMVAFAGYPLVVHDRLVGVTALFSRHALTNETLESLSSIASVVALGIERRRAEEFRFESEARKSAMLEAALDCIVSIDTAGRITDFNPAAERTFGHRREDVLGKELADVIIPPPYREQHRRGLARYLETGVATVLGKRIELTALRADGTQVPVELAIVPIVSGGSISFTGYLRDISDRRAAEAERAERLTREQVARRQAEQASRDLQDSEKRFHLLAETIPQLAWAAHADGHIDWYNRRWYEYTGTRFEQMEGWGWKSVHEPTMLGEVIARWSAALEAGLPFEMEFPLRRHDGVFRWHLTRAVPLRDDAGRLLRWFGTNTDIDDAKRADAERSALLTREQAARQLLSTTLRSIADAVIATDASGHVTFMNVVAESLTGWSQEDAMGKPLAQVFRIVDARTGLTVESPTDRVIREGVIVGLANHTVLLAKDGRQIAIDDSGAPIRDESGQLTGVVLVFRDVTAKKREEERRDFLTEASPALASLLDVKQTLSRLAHLAVPKLADWCAVDMVSEVPPGFQQIAVAHVDGAKVAMAEELGKRYPPDPNAKVGVPQVLRSGKSELYTEIPEELLAAGAVDAEHLRILRELRLESAMTVPIVARGSVLGAITFIFARSGRRYKEDDLEFAEEFARRAGVALDNARLFESEQNARRNADVANRAKDDFLATVSHELRTPLNAMLGWTRMLRTSELSIDKRERALETIERNAVTQAQLIEDLLDVSRIISGKLRLDVQSLELANIVEQTMDSLRLASDAKNVRVVAALAANAGPIMGDPHRLQQVVWNLMSNAIKFTPKGGRIVLSLERVDSDLRLTVTDNGQGISAEFLPHVFERFKQADGATTRTFGGLGLGLAISRHIVELHGGSIDVHSKGEGHGTTFTVRLPVSVVRDEIRETSSRLSSIPGAARFAMRPELKDLRVLIVDDDDDAREMLAAVLESSGAIVTAASSAAEALARIATDKPDILISDIGMPGENGYDLIRKVRALPHDQGANIPAAALTAYARAEDRRKALDAGFMMHIPKPVEPAELIAVVANLTRFAVRR